MGLRFPRHGAGGHERASAAGLASPEMAGSADLPLHSLLAIPDRACCCTAKPMVRVIMPATRTRPHPVDLWRCGHHWRASREALGAAGATVHQVSVCDARTQADRAAAAA